MLLSQSEPFISLALRLARVPPDVRHWQGRKGLCVRVKLLIAAALLAAVAHLATGTAKAQSLCTEPTMPMPVDGTAATADQMRAVMAAARDFIAQSGLYQECLQKEVDGAKSQAGGQASEPALETSVHAKIDASKKAQERVGITVNNALAAYKNAHPN